MNLKRTQRDEPDLNLTPLIDVVFLLLIFFMVTTTFVKEADLQIVLPESTAKAETQQRVPVEIAIDAQGRYFINQKEVVNTTLETLVIALKKAKVDKKLGIVIRADARTPHASVVTAMDASGQAGISKISIATVERAAQ